VFYSPIDRRVFVGDRANDRVIAFDARTFDVDGLAAAGAGVFHMWGNRATGELWVNNDADNTTSVMLPFSTGPAGRPPGSESSRCARRSSSCACTGVASRDGRALRPSSYWTGARTAA